MYVYFKDQLIFLTVSVLCGVFLSFIYDIFRVLRIARGYNIKKTPIPEDYRPKSKFLSLYTDHYLTSVKKKRSSKIAFLMFMADDILFSVIISLFVVVIVYGYNNGIPRAFSFFGFCLGFCLWRMTGGRVVIYLSERICFLVGALFFYLFYPIYFLFTKIKKLIYKTYFVLYNKRVKAKKQKKEKIIEKNEETKMKLISSSIIYMEKK